MKYSNTVSMPKKKIEEMITICIDKRMPDVLITKLLLIRPAFDKRADEMRAGNCKKRVKQKIEEE
ncbi:hypothetical protein [Dialister sp.]|uniref:hypothetical protein n=1 Tax=Dialister sp. TaxID=1955814 RepID=UPI003F0B68B0